MTSYILLEGGTDRLLEEDGTSILVLEDHTAGGGNPVTIDLTPATGTGAAVALTPSGGAVSVSLTPATGTGAAIATVEGCRSGQCQHRSY